MFRRRGGGNGDLPTAAPSSPVATNKRPSSSLLTPLTSKPPGGEVVDGSARSIKLQRKSLKELWREASGPTKATYICLVSFLLCLWYGIRLIRYYNAYIHLDCQSTTCRITVQPIGFANKRLVLNDVPRRQLIQAYAVKTDVDGNFKMANPRMDDDYLAQRKQTGPGGKYKKAPKYSSAYYKGPDPKDGQYFSYAIVLRDRPQNLVRPQQTARGEAETTATDQFVDLSSLEKYTTTSGSGGTGSVSYKTMRLTMRQFRIGQSKRRVRTMLTRIDSYIKHRRQRLLVKENGIPSWQGILLIVLGIIGFLLTILIGQFYDEPPPSSTGPGVRRQAASRGKGGNKRLHYDYNNIQKRRASQQKEREERAHRTKQELQSEAYARPTPAKYEVRTKPSLQNRFK